MKIEYKDLMSTKDLSRYLGYMYNTINEWCRKGRILYRKYQGKYVFNKSEIDILLKNNIIKRKEMVTNERE